MARLRKSDALAVAALAGIAIVLVGGLLKAFVALARSAGWVSAFGGVIGFTLITSAIAERDLLVAVMMLLPGIALAAAPFVGLHLKGKARREAASAYVAAEQTRVSTLESTCAQLVMRHAEALGRKREQLVFVDDYGVERTDKWSLEHKRFVHGVVVPAIANLRGSESDDDILLSMAPLIEDAAKRAKPCQMSQKSLTEMSPAEFEQHCADIAKRCGWNARVMGGSGDQGVDVIAERAGVRVVFQCKLYARSVNNSAVQEIVAGKAHYRAHFAAVVSNQDYTPGARMLAKTNKVALLYPSGIPGFLAKVDAWRDQKQRAVA